MTSASNGASAHSQEALPPSVEALMSQLPKEFAALTPLLLRGGNMTGLRTFSADELNALYTAGYDLCVQGRFEDASKVFGLLVGLHPTEARFHQALASCFQRLGRFEDAARSYMLLKFLEPENHEALFRLAECLIATGDREAAIHLLDTVVEEGKQSQVQEWKQRAEALVKLLRQPEPSGGQARASAPHNLPSEHHGASS